MCWRWFAKNPKCTQAAQQSYTENLTIGLSLKIIRSDPTTTIVDGGGVSMVVTISATEADVTLSKMTIRNGSAQNGGGISVSYNLAETLDAYRDITWGGGIYKSNGAVTINNGTISDNTLRVTFGTVEGFGIWSSGSVTLQNSIIANPVASRGSWSAVSVETGDYTH